MLTMLLPVMVGISGLSFLASQYFNEKSIINEKNPQFKLGDNIFFTAMEKVYFNLFVISFPMIINLTWVGLSAINTGELGNLVSLFEGFSILSWFSYSAYIGLMILRFAINILGDLNKMDK